jgi:ectoine hydroxylase
MNSLFADPYPSRQIHEPLMLRRNAPVIWRDFTDKPAWISEQQLQHYDQHGYMVLDNILTPEEVKQLQVAATDLRQKFADSDMPETIKEPESQAVRSVFNLPAHCPIFDQLTRHSKLVELAEFILDSKVYLHQSRLNYKPGFRGKEFYWHSDFETWHIEDGMPEMRALSCSVLLTDNHAYNGPLMVIPASHRMYVGCVGETPDENYRHSLRQQQIGTPCEIALSTLSDLGGGIHPITGAAGTIVLFDCNLLHGSAGNISPDSRSNAFFVYNSVENTLGEPAHNLTPRPEYLAHRQVKKLNRN